ncbi:SMC-Scp complex subunit ScpB [Microbulbifer agarilyticus]|uniref:SMC-Scp complex subunit ScpB n=1 Tax=Microbulbifer agarilyticus TaxID=260552 RepID=UPI001C97A029|nr:SMC-Scp complex subunit ScpB [Microbulbifer agarilyticus]MBY6211132.1 SMC-Scp complex subunit ScpB [Microbulbifer agarilyticus]
MSIAPELLRRIVEGALMAAGQPLSEDRLLSLIDEGERPEKSELKQALEEIAESCAERGFELKQVASGWRFQVPEELAPWVNKLWEEKPQKYSRATLETLAIIAYRQPITRGDIEEIRGVAVSSHIVKSLSERGWIKVVGQRDVPGKPSLYATTREFLDYFNLKSLDDLPTLAEIRDIESLNAALDLGDGAPVPEGDAQAAEAGAEDAAEAEVADETLAEDAGEAAAQDADESSEETVGEVADEDIDHDIDEDTDEDADEEIDEEIDEEPVATFYEGAQSKGLFAAADEAAAAQVEIAQDDSEVYPEEAAADENVPAVEEESAAQDLSEESVTQELAAEEPVAEGVLDEDDLQQDAQAEENLQDVAEGDGQDEDEQQSPENLHS